jgi:hypothetical protein
MLISEHATPIDVPDFVVFPGDPDWDAVRQTFNLLRNPIRSPVGSTRRSTSPPRAA